MEEKMISQAVIKRLPRYYRYLGELIMQDIERISSGDLSRKMNVTASQIRQDLNNFGGFGQQGYGYNVKYLYSEIGKILGLDKVHKVVIIGAGNIGRALAKYRGFDKNGFQFISFFDNDESLYDQTIAGLKIRPVTQLKEFVQEYPVDIAVLTIPKEYARETAREVVAAGIPAIWNFAQLDLGLPDNVMVENVHLSESLMLLSYSLHELERKNS